MHITVKRIDSSACADVRLPNEPFPLCGRMLPAYDGQWSYTVTVFPPQERSEMVFPDEVYDFEAMAQARIRTTASASGWPFIAGLGTDICTCTT